MMRLVVMQWLRLTPASGSSTTPSVLNNNDVINALITELPNYVAAAQDVPMASEDDKVKW